MKAVLAVVGILVGVVLLSYVLGFIATGGEYATYKFWAPKQADAERQVFENSQPYVQGKITHIGRLIGEYKTADEQHKSALRTMIIDEAATIDNNKLPADEQEFIAKLKGEF